MLLFPDPMKTIFPAVLLSALCLSPALEAADAKADYEQLQRWHFSTAIPLPAEGVTIQRDNATWTLQSGSVRLMEPLSDGAVTGLVFEGSGRFRMSVPDPYELAQLRRFAKKGEITEIDQPITQLVLRTSDASIASLFPAATGPYEQNKIAEKRHEAWLVDLHDNVDAGIIAARLNGMTQLTAGMETADYGWLTYEYDSTRTEEISLVRWHYLLAETWLSLDRAEDRQKDGRPGRVPSAPVSLDHIDVKADLTKYGRSGRVGDHEQRALDGRYVVESTFTARRDGVGALRLDLWSTARDVEAFAEDGAPLAVLRDHIGKRAMKLDNKLYDDDFVVILPAPLKNGESTKVRFEYTVETANYAPGGLWYPTVADTQLQKHTARLEMTVRSKNELRSMGRLESRRDNGGTETTVWVIDAPVKMVTFSTATRFEEVKVEPQGIPPVISFGPDYQRANTTRIRNVAADVANSMQFFQNLFDDKIVADQFYVTSIAGHHGQAFDGFLHMGEFTYESEHPGASELFRAHEVAHQWWGHKIGWASYRDQWLSEALAEYSAMMFVEGFVKNGSKYFDEILRSYDGIVRGNMAGGFSKFNRPWLIEWNTAYLNRLGPIGHGYRASTGEVPAGYIIQTYHKGPLALHVMRMLLLHRTNSDELFVKTLRNFVREYSGKNASTDDFRRVAEQTTQTDWGWFFDAWIYRAEIPSYTWRQRVEPEGNEFLLTLEIERTGVDDSFMTAIPVRVEFDGGKAGTFFVPSKQSKQTIARKLPSRPKKVIFAPDKSVIGSVRQVK